MPEKLTPEIMQFRQTSLLEFMQEMLNTNKACGGGENILCLMPWDHDSDAASFSPGMWGGAGWYGVVDWEPFMQLENLDVFSTDPYWIHCRPFSFFESNTKLAIELAHQYGKRCQIWAQAIWIAPGKEEEVKRTILSAAELGADMVAVWSFRGEPGASAIDFGGDHTKVWSMVKEAYRMI